MTDWLQLINDGLTWLFSHVCHQDPSRTWHWGGVPLFVCQRCLGMYTGFVLGFVVTRLARRRQRRLTPLPFVVHAALIGVALLFFVKVLPDTALTRTVSGLGFGVGIGFFLALSRAAKRAADTGVPARRFINNDGTSVVPTTVKKVAVRAPDGDLPQTRAAFAAGVRRAASGQTRLRRTRLLLREG